MSIEDDVNAIREAWQKEGSLGRLGLLPAADQKIQAALVPEGGEWECAAGRLGRSITWGDTEVALVDPRGDLTDHIAAGVAMGLRAAPVMDKALRVIFILSGDAANSDLIGRIARTAIAVVERAAPALHAESGEC